MDDEPLIRYGLRRELQRDFDVLEAGNVAEALSVLESNPQIRVVVSDCHMGPGPTGLKLLKEVWERAPQVIRILASGTITHRTIDKLPEEFVHSFVAKPWSPNFVRDLIKQELAKHRS